MEVLPFPGRFLLGARNLCPVKSPDGREPRILLLIVFHFPLREIFAHLVCQDLIIPEH